jgi:hypothetical protein
LLIYDYTAQQQVRFQVLTAASMNTTVFWDIDQCSPVEADTVLEVLSAIIIKMTHRPDNGNSEKL